MIDSNTGKMFSQDSLPLKGIKVTEFTHMIMGPAVGAILADLGAEVIRIEPVTGDKTRLLPGSGIGFFTSFNRNKRSIALDIKSDQGKDSCIKADSGIRCTDREFQTWHHGKTWIRL